MDYPRRKTTRLENWDYSENAAYFVTICTQDRACILSEIPVGALHEAPAAKLTKMGMVVQKVIESLPERYPAITIDKYVIMPNHIHMILVIKNSTDETARMYPRPTLGIAIGNFKSAVTREIHNTEPEIKVWQTGFYDHIIRDIPDYENIWTYIDENPIKWDSDEYY